MRRATWMTIIGLAVLVVMTGCASNLTEQEQFDREYQRGIIREAHALCQAAVAATPGVTWIVVYSGGRSPSGAQDTIVDLKADLWRNNCMDWLKAQGFDL